MKERIMEIKKVAEKWNICDEKKKAVKCCGNHQSQQPIVTTTNNNTSNKSLSRISSGDHKRT